MEAVINVLEEEVLSSRWMELRKTTFQIRGRDGQWQRQEREVYYQSPGAAVLLYNIKNRSIILVRQFRLAAYATDGAVSMLEVCAGLINDNNPSENDPLRGIQRETEEETGYLIQRPLKVAEVYTSPGASAEKLHLFLAEYDPASRSNSGGGLAEEGENIEVVELSFEEALALLNNGQINDSKTLILLQHAVLAGILALA